ncbi:GIY-YIG nuclease family protein [Acholeplasma granularum]|uniref:GIY-YIG nuclease family protein n=1 Tax=Acholeplasma granularum TaxID=264635 RepID=UPI00046EEE6B|nr:GIY-YIG nuclease family protein [Acholeplasma granularum]
MILLNDLFLFDNLIKQYKSNKRIKLRFNTNFKDKKNHFTYDFVDMYTSKSNDFLPYILSIGSGKKARNDEKDIQFQFIEVEDHRWLFVGAYEIIEPKSNIHINQNGISFNYAKALRLSNYDKFIDRVIVEWINKPRQFFYVDKEIINNIKISEISSKPYFERQINFPGYENLSMTYYDLKQHLNNQSFIEHLSTIYAVYLITDIKKGKLYVGAAYGHDGLYGRWSTYLKEGYDRNELEDSKYPNVKLKELVTKEGLSYIQDNFKYTILEIFPKTEIGKQQALLRETYWKEVFMTKTFGYNAN